MKVASRLNCALLRNKDTKCGVRCSNSRLYCRQQTTQHNSTQLESKQKTAEYKLQTQTSIQQINTVRQFELAFEFDNQKWNQIAQAKQEFELCRATNELILRLFRMLTKRVFNPESLIQIRFAFSCIYCDASLPLAAFRVSLRAGTKATKRGSFISQAAHE